MIEELYSVSYDYQLFLLIIVHVLVQVHIDHVHVYKRKSHKIFKYILKETFYLTPFDTAAIGVKCIPLICSADTDDVDDLRDISSVGNGDSTGKNISFDLLEKEE